MDVNFPVNGEEAAMDMTRDSDNELEQWLCVRWGYINKVGG